MNKSLIMYNPNSSMIDECKLMFSQYHKPDAPTILFLEPYGSSISLLKHGVEHGYNLIILTANSDLRHVSQSIINLATLAIQIDTADQDLILAFVNRLSLDITIHAVIPGFEYFVPLAAHVSHALNLPGISIDNVESLRNKYLMRSCLSANGISVPLFSLVYSHSEVEGVMDSIGFPAVCKPIDAAGSVNVKKVMNLREATLAASRILDGSDVLWGHVLSNAVLCEEYIEGKEYSAEGVICNGKVNHFGITEKMVNNQIEFIEVGHIVNPPISNDLRMRIENYINSVIAALKPNYCPFHAEFRVKKNGEIVLMEIAARLAGDKIGDLINLVYQENYYDAVYAAYLGKNFENAVLFKSHDMSAGIRFFYRPDVECYQTIDGIDIAKKYSPHDLAFYYEPNQRIPDFPLPLRRLGHVIIADKTYDTLPPLLSTIDQAISFV